MQTKLLCSLLLLTGISAYASEKSNEIPVEQKIAAVINYLSSSPGAKLAWFAKLESMSGGVVEVAPIETVTSKSGNVVKCSSSAQKENT